MEENEEQVVQKNSDISAEKGIEDRFRLDKAAILT